MLSKLGDHRIHKLSRVVGIVCQRLFASLYRCVGNVVRNRVPNTGKPHTFFNVNHGLIISQNHSG